jgi:hypothetical protein
MRTGLVEESRLFDVRCFQYCCGVSGHGEGRLLLDRRHGLAGVAFTTGAPAQPETKLFRRAL